MHPSQRQRSQRRSAFPFARFFFVLPAAYWQRAFFLLVSEREAKPLKVGAAFLISQISG
jgi:hypothetical protein